MKTASVKTAGPSYLTQCACFDCRKVFKKEIKDPYYIPQCPQCGIKLNIMGRNFRAPRQTDAAQWLKVEKLLRAGISFTGRQSDELGEFPATLLEADQFIARNQKILTKRMVARAVGRENAIANHEELVAKRALVRKQSKLKKAKAAALAARPK